MKGLFAITVLCVSCYLVGAWVPRYGENRLWPSIRRTTRCVLSNEECIYTGQCCDKYDVCLLDYRYYLLKSGQKIGICKKLKYQRNGVYAMKEVGETCSDSSDCAPGLCCREKERHRMKPSLRCAEPEEPYICIENAKFDNSIYQK